MRRRDFITRSGMASAWLLSPRIARTQERVRRVGMLMNSLPEDAEAQAHVAAFQQGMQELGWSVGGNRQIELRWGGNDPDRWRRQVREVLGLTPDVVVGAGAIAVSYTHLRAHETGRNLVCR